MQTFGHCCRLQYQCTDKIVFRNLQQQLLNDILSVCYSCSIDNKFILVMMRHGKHKSIGNLSTDQSRIVSYVLAPSSRPTGEAEGNEAVD